MAYSIHIRNMVCQRCIRAVEVLLDQQGIPYRQVSLGEVSLDVELTAQQREQLAASLQEVGFELLQSIQATLIDQIKTLIIDLIHYRQEPLPVNYSDYIAQQLHHPYKSMSTLFSATEGITIEKFIILQKVEKVKELLFYNEMPLKEIASRMHYSSVQHLSKQFKNTTGMTPNEYKILSANTRNPLDRLH